MLRAAMLTAALMTTPALAQDAAAPEAAPAAAPLTKDTATVGQVYVASTSAPWETRCTKTEAGNDPCQLFQLLKDDKGSPVAEVNLFGVVPNPNAAADAPVAAAGAAVVAPLETLLAAGVVLQIDDKEAKVYPFAFCNSYGCVARIGFTADELANMKSGKQVSVAIVPAVAPDKKVVLTMSLDGFTAGFDAVAATLPAQ